MVMLLLGVSGGGVHLRLGPDLCHVDAALVALAVQDDFAAVLEVRQLAQLGTLRRIPLDGEELAHHRLAVHHDHSQGRHIVTGLRRPPRRVSRPSGSTPPRRRISRRIRSSEFRARRIFAIISMEFIDYIS